MFMEPNSVYGARQNLLCQTLITCVSRDRWDCMKAVLKLKQNSERA